MVGMVGQGSPYLATFWIISHYESEQLSSALGIGICVVPLNNSLGGAGGLSGAGAGGFEAGFSFVFSSELGIKIIPIYRTERLNFKPDHFNSIHGEKTLQT